jgi:trigger factor
LYRQASQFPGQERMLFEYYSKNPQALQSLRAPLYEDKVVDFILELAQVSDKPVSREELFKEPDDA